MTHHEYINLNTRRTRPNVNPGTRLLPPEVLELGGPALVEAARTWQQIDNAARDHAAKAAEEDRAAKAATADYQQRVKDALVSGDDPAKVKDTTAQHKARAEAHRELAAQAKREATANGYVLGEAIAAAAPEITPTLDQQLHTIADDISHHLEAVNEAWQQWGRIFGARRIMSWAGIAGGTIAGYGAAQVRPPAGALDGLRVVADALAQLDQLAHEEAELKAKYEHEERVAQDVAAMREQHDEQLRKSAAAR